jgi:nicotinate-nucleotide adenylyltransferase
VNLQPPIGILGGTFDPIHYAHLRLGEELADRVGLEQVRFVPARIPPHRATPNVTAEHRLEMTRLATAGNPRFSVDDRECRREGPSYTLDTLHELRAELGPARPLCLLMGVDAYLGLMTWSRWPQLYEAAHVVIAHRPGFALDTRAMPGELAQQTVSRLTADPQALHARPGGLVIAVDIPSLDISATVIRTLIHTGHSARYLLPDDVLDYIERNRLYKDFDAD